MVVPLPKVEEISSGNNDSFGLLLSAVTLRSSSVAPPAPPFSASQIRDVCVYVLFLGGSPDLTTLFFFRRLFLGCHSPAR